MYILALTALLLWLPHKCVSEVKCANNLTLFSTSPILDILTYDTIYTKSMDQECINFAKSSTGINRLHKYIHNTTTDC